MHNLVNFLSGLVAQAARHGPRFALRAFIWKMQTAAHKTRLALEDRFGFYTYQHWIRDFEKPASLPLPDRSATALHFSLLVSHPASSRGSADLALTVHSIANQTYPGWEARLVCTTPGKSPPPDWPEDDPRFVPFQATGGQAWLEAIADARGDFVIALSSGSTLAAHTLNEFALGLNANPEWDILYSDEDHLRPDGATRHSPFFKPDWSPELMHSVNFIANAAFRRDLLLKSSSAFQGEGPPYYQNLTYQALDGSPHVGHLPQVLVHLPTSMDFPGIPEKKQPSTPISPHLVSIIIPTRDQAHYLKRCIESIYKFDRGTPFEIILVDSGSQEPATLAYYDTIHAFPNIRFVEFQGPFNFSAALNAGARHASGDLLLFLNNDTEALHAGWLEDLAHWASLPGVGIVGPKLLYPDGTIQHAGLIIGMQGHAGHVFAGSHEGASGPFGSPDWVRNYSAVTGACMLMRRDIFESLGGFDEAYRLVFSDVEICLRARSRGYRVVYTPHAHLRHYEGRTRALYMPQEDLRLGYEHFKDIVQHNDPFYNPNLSTSVKIPSLRRPGEETPISRLEHILQYATGRSTP